MRKVMITAAAIASAAALALSGCAGGGGDSGRGGDSAGDAASGFEEGSVIGVALPDKTSENWTIAGEIFTEALTEAGIAGSIGSVGDALDNALMESTIGLFKTELIDRRRSWTGRNEVERETAAWVH